MTITLRWEWRTFARRFTHAEQAFEGQVPDSIGMSDDCYLLSDAGDNVKLRDDRVDVKVLDVVDARGLERWRPTMKEEFPLSRADVQRVLEALRLPALELSREAYSAGQLLSGLIEPRSDVHAVWVNKRRARYIIMGCMAEAAELIVDGREARTIAFESEDAQVVMEVVRTLGLEGHDNVNYPRGLRILLGGEHARTDG